MLGLGILDIEEPKYDKIIDDSDRIIKESKKICDDSDRIIKESKKIIEETNKIIEECERLKRINDKWYARHEFFNQFEFKKF